MAATKKIEAKTTFYKDKSGDWRWKITKGSKIIGASTEGYKNRIECRENYFEIHVATAIGISKSIKKQWVGLAGIVEYTYKFNLMFRDVFSKAK